MFFLDINLPGVSGLELAEQLLESKPDVTIVFVTAYDQYALQAFEYNAIDYLVKPVNAQRLQKTVDRLKAKISLPHPSVQKEVKAQVLSMNVCLSLSFQTEERNTLSIAWRTSKAQELFLYLIHRRGQLVNKSYLIDLLWQDLKPERAFSQLYTSIYHIRKTLNQFSDHFKITNLKDGYILSTSNVIIDIEEWERELLQLTPLSTKTIDAYIKTMNRYKGPYLHEYNYWWAEHDQYRLEQLWLDHAFKIANYFHAHAQLLEAKHGTKRL